MAETHSARDLRKALAEFQRVIRAVEVEVGRHANSNGVIQAWG
jgi:hypothetical protein